MSTPAPIHYTIKPANPGAHLFHVTLTIAQPTPNGQTVSLPAWIPGSYMIREFAKNIVTIQARCKGRSVALTKLDKQTWRASSSTGPLEIECEIYAWDLSVRTAHLDQTHGFFNGTSVFLRVHRQEDAPHRVTMLPPDAPNDWQVATALARSKDTKPLSFGDYQAANYDELIDHPVELGTFTHARFTAGGVPHEIAIPGRHATDMKRLVVDVKRICEYQLAFFGKPADLERYVFLVMAVGDGYGGLEHRASTALICGRDDLPYVGMKEATEGYRTFLGLVSHEYFHTWNVKRIKPAAFTPYDLTQENYTRQLWLFEGFTSYYDDLVLVRTGLITQEQYFTALGKTISAVRRGTGQSKQSVAESSFDAWTKYYRQDENAPNAITSYYAKGALVGLALDLHIRAQTNGARSLDDVMRALWREHGQTGIGVDESVDDSVAEEIAALVSGLDLKRFFASYVHGTADIPLEKFLAPFGIVLKATPGKASLGVKTAAAADGVKLTQVWDGGSAQAAGLSAGDLIVAADGLRVSISGFDELLRRAQAAKRKLHLHVFRRDELMEFDVRPGEDAFSAWLLEPMPRTSPSIKRLQKGWLKSE